MNLLIVGAPGAGKGTMSDLLVEKYGVIHVSTGDMLRSAIKEGTKTGLKAQEYMNKGLLVPDEVIHDIIVERLAKDDIKQGFLMDGYPRNVEQAKDFDSILKELKQKIDLVISLNIEDELLMKRVTGRRLCPTCGEIYNIYFRAPKQEGICDKCNSALNQRKDDNAESLKVRLNEYHTVTEPVINYYREQGLVDDVDSSKDIGKVFEDVCSVIEGLK